MLNKIKDILEIALVIFIIGVVTFILVKPAEEKETVPVVIDVKIPEIKGQSDTIYLRDTIYKNNIVYRDTGINEELLREYKQAKDSITKLNLFIASITEREVTTTFKDSIQEVKVNSRVRGSLLSQNISYTIFERNQQTDTEAEVDFPEKFKFYGMGELGGPLYSPEGNFSVRAKANFIVQNRKDQLLSLGVDTDLWAWLGFGMKF